MAAATPPTYEQLSGSDQWCGSKTADWGVHVKIFVVISLLGFIEPSSGVLANRTVGFFLMPLLNAPEEFEPHPGDPLLIILLSSLCLAPPLSKKLIGPVMHDNPASAAACLNDWAMIEVM